MNGIKNTKVNEIKVGNKKIGKYFVIFFSIIINPCERIALHFQRGDFKF
jgi:hypothetical protein